ncbi:hypothetical protein GT346_15850, partial [Streptomyces sp. SID161]|nr:hypothetical protein [Streptomyces sp. SID161]
TRRAWWLLPAEAAVDDIDDFGFTVRPAGWELLCPPVVHSIGSLWWLSIPDGTGYLTDPALLAAAMTATGPCVEEGTPA